MLLRVAHGKGAKERLVPLSPRLLQELRQYWKLVRPERWLFPGGDAEKPLSDTTVQKSCKRAAREAGITKHVSPHVLRHSHATALLESGVDLLTISRLLGHRSFSTTLIYLHLRRPHLESVQSPLDLLVVVARRRRRFRGVEFVARYMQHMLPHGFVRIRYYGLLSNGQRRQQRARCRAMIGVPSEPAPSGAVASKDSEPREVNGRANPDVAACPSCGRGRLVLTETWPRMNGWPWASRSSKSKLPDRPVPNTIEEFLARRRIAPSTKPAREALRRDTS